MSTEAALLAAIVADPDDDTARLVYADFLEEKGGESDTARAQFIRAQVELARSVQKGESAQRRELLSRAKRLLGPRMTEWQVDGSSGVTDQAAWIISRATSFTHITALSFSNTDITDDGVEILGKAEHLSGLRELDFRNTNLSHRAAMAVARSPVFANLEKLNFVKTWINGFGAKALRDSKYLKKIKFLALYDAVPGASEAALKKRFGRKVEFGRV